MSAFLGLDVGTQGTKALVWDAERGMVVGRGAREYDLLPVDRPGAAEQDPATWIDAAKGAIREALACTHVEAEAILGIGVSGQQHGFVALDAKDEVLRPAKLWCDTETAPEAEELSSVIGRPIPAGFTASKILWLKRHEPERFARLAHVLLPHDYVNLWLTGERVMEAGDASGTGLFDPVARDFDSTAVKAVDEGLADKLPSLVGPDEPIGVLRPELAGELGLPAGVQVAPGSGDNMMSALGSGCVREGVVVISLGTSGTLFGYSKKAVVDPEGIIAPFCDASGAYLPLLCTMNCTTATEETRAAYGLDLDELTGLAGEEAPGCDGVSFLPYFAGERAPNWPHASGVLHGLRPGSLRPGLVFRAAMEGATFTMLAGWERMRAHGLEATELRVVGGGSRNLVWRRILANSFQLPLRFPTEEQSAALGGALQAAAVVSGRKVAEFVAAQRIPLEDGALEPDRDRADAYAEAARRHRELGQTLFDA